MGSFECLPCSRYFANELALATHVRGKPHKRRLKTLEEAPYTVEESYRAAGVGVDNGPGRSVAATESKAAPPAKQQSQQIEVET